MPTTYSKAKPPILDLLADAIARYHGPLKEAEVTVGVLCAWPGPDDEHPVKLHGYPCLATIRVTPYRQRVHGIEDAVITLDGPAWAQKTEAEQLAILDHELQHLELVRDRDGILKADDQGRPKLKLRLHDWQLGGFEVIAQRHGQAAAEVQAFRAERDQYYQSVFAWSDDMAGEPVQDCAEPAQVEVTGPSGQTVSFTSADLDKVARVARAARAAR